MIRFVSNKCIAFVLIVGLLAVAAMFAGGCSSSHTHTRSPYENNDGTVRDQAKAQQLTVEAAELIQTKPDKAEQMLIDALIADLYHGPAHNNLGVVYLGRGDLYNAANEFEWARKLMPGHPDPRMNLAITLERAGRTDEALDEYATALEVYPGHMPTMQAIARLRLREGRGIVTGVSTDSSGSFNGHSSVTASASIADSTPSTRELLREIALRGETPQWRDWAQLQLAKHN